jgi:hypothetical protein
VFTGEEDTMDRVKLWMVMPIVISALSACTTPMFTMPPGPEPYRLGYHNGCDAGYAYAGSPLVAAATSARTDGWYQIGFNEGFQRCQYNYQHMQKIVNSVLGPPL